MGQGCCCARGADNHNTGEGSTEARETESETERMTRREAMRIGDSRLGRCPRTVGSVSQVREEVNGLVLG